MWSITVLAEENKVIVFGTPPDEIIDALDYVPIIHLADTNETWYAHDDT